jgi:hypothetical protein
MAEWVNYESGKALEDQLEDPIYNLFNDNEGSSDYKP